MMHSRQALPPGVAEADTSLPALLRHWARTQPERLALREKDRGIWKGYSFGEYYARVRRFALYLQSIGFARGDKLVIAADGSPEWFFADLAAQSLGGVTVGIYPTNPWPELQYIVRHCRARIAVCGDQEQTDKVLEAMRRDGGLPDLQQVLTIDWKGMRHYDDACLKHFDAAVAEGAALESDAGALARFDAGIDAIRAGDDAIIVYTSGTTGMPKGARIAHRGVIFAARAFGDVHDFAHKPPLSVVCYLPLCHVAERLMSPIIQLVYGSVVNFAESIDTVTENVVEIGPTYFFGVPRIWEKLQYQILIRSRESRPLARKAFQKALAIATPIAERALANGGDYASWRDRAVAWLLRVTVFDNLLAAIGLDRALLAATGGASISPTVILFFRALGVPIFQIYGMTETSGATHIQAAGNVALGWTGAPVAGMEQKVAEDGELLLRGPMVFNGYLYDDAATAATIIDGWLHTGDVVEMDPTSGAVMIVDRKKAIIITSGGKNITPSLIENALKESLYISEAVLLGEARNFVAALIQIDLDTVGKWAQERALAYTTYETLAVLPQVRDLIEQDVKRVNERFSRVESIRKFVIIRKQLDHDDGELTATMKVRRRVIEQKFSDDIATIYGAA